MLKCINNWPRVHTKRCGRSENLSLLKMSTTHCKIGFIAIALCRKPLQLPRAKCYHFQLINIGLTHASSQRHELFDRPPVVKRQYAAVSRAKAWSSDASHCTSYLRVVCYIVMYRVLCVLEVDFFQYLHGSNYVFRPIACVANCKPLSVKGFLGKDRQLCYLI